MEPERNTAMTVRQLTTALFAMLAVSIAVMEISAAPPGEGAEVACGCPL